MQIPYIPCPENEKGMGGPGRGRFPFPDSTQRPQNSEDDIIIYYMVALTALNGRSAGLLPAASPT